MLERLSALGVVCGLLGLVTAMTPAPSAAPRAEAASAAPSSPGLSAPVVAVPDLVVPDRVRVGLATDLDSVTLPCCGADLRAQAGSTLVALVEPFEVAPAAAGGRGVYRLQVAALKDEVLARNLATELARAHAEPADVVFDAAIDLYRVRFGRYSRRSDAEEASRRLATSGVVGSFVVSEPSAAVAEGLRVTQGDDSWRVRGRWVALWSSSGAAVRLPEGQYRGRILVYLNDRGSLNLINELPLEDYLRGVVPREMGPERYDDLEGLKAQAVAARSYAVRNFGEFAAEGYDICATPRCQVYGGRGAEHSMSDRAVAETSGQILVHGGEPVDALYSSTCGGHTEDVSVVFPQKDEPYLKAVPCYEAGLTEVAGDLAAGAPFPEGVTRRLFPANGAQGPIALATRLERLARDAGLVQPSGSLSALTRREVTRYVANWLDLAMEAELFVTDPDVSYAFAQAPPGWSRDEVRVAAYLARLGVLDGAIDSAPSVAEIERSLMSLAILLQVVEPTEGRFASISQRVLTVRSSGALARYEIPPSLATFRGRDGAMRSSPLSLIPGDHLDLYSKDGVLAAVVQKVEPAGAAYDRGSRFASWRRFRSDREISELLGASYPGFEFRDLAVLERGRSGRVGKIRFMGRDGTVAEVEGLAVRWTLDLPDTLFTARRLRPPGQEEGWLFTGRGWGHGVGMCQVGAYGMALRGHGYRDILTHYYSGVSLATLKTVPRDRFRGVTPAP
jgi:stage II sporulation protein D